MIKKNEIVQIVWDSEKRKFRAQAKDGSWVRFPNHLREAGASFMVDLKTGKAGSWITTGDIRKVSLSTVSYR